MGQKQTQGYAAHAEIQHDVGRERSGGRRQPCGFTLTPDTNTEPFQRPEHGVDIVATGYAVELGRAVGEGGHEQLAQRDGLAAGQGHICCEGTRDARNGALVGHGLQGRLRLLPWPDALPWIALDRASC